jgi:hypothetical protein
VQVTSASTWEGLGAGHGHLRARRLDLAVDGRRIPRTRRGSIWFPAAPATVATGITVVQADDAPASSATVALRRTG